MIHVTFETCSLKIQRVLALRAGSCHTPQQGHQRLDRQVRDQPEPLTELQLFLSQRSSTVNMGNL